MYVDADRLGPPMPSVRLDIPVDLDKTGLSSLSLFGLDGADMVGSFFEAASPLRDGAVAIDFTRPWPGLSGPAI